MSGVVDVLEEQLHEQYAINNNKRTSTLISLFVALVVVLGYFGYMYVHSELVAAKDFGGFVLKQTYTIEPFLFSGSVSLFIVWIINRLAILQGASQREFQFIVQKIRDKHGMDKTIFPDHFHPMQKTIKNFVQGLCGELVLISEVVYWAILVLTLLKLFYTDFEWSSITRISFEIFILSATLSYLSMQFFLAKEYRNYLKIEKKYKEVGMCSNKEKNSPCECVGIAIKVVILLFVVGFSCRECKLREKNIEQTIVKNGDTVTLRCLNDTSVRCYQLIK